MAENLMNKEQAVLYTPEQFSDTKRLLDIINSAPKEKRSFIIAMGTAYMDGMIAGRLTNGAHGA